MLLSAINQFKRVCSLTCCVFWPALRCSVHLKASWPTFLAVFKLFCWFQMFFVIFHPKTRKNAWKRIFKLCFSFPTIFPALTSHSCFHFPNISPLFLCFSIILSNRKQKASLPGIWTSNLLINSRQHCPRSPDLSFCLCLNLSYPTVILWIYNYNFVAPLLLLFLKLCFSFSLCLLVCLFLSMPLSAVLLIYHSHFVVSTKIIARVHFFTPLSIRNEAKKDCAYNWCNKRNTFSISNKKYIFWWELV